MLSIFRSKAASAAPADDPTSPYEAAVRFYERQRAAWKVHLNALSAFERANPDWPERPEYDALDRNSDEWCGRETDALRALLQLQARTVADALLKLDIALYNGEDAAAESALFDLRRLTGIDRPVRLALEKI